MLSRNYEIYYFQLYNLNELSILNKDRIIAQASNHNWLILFLNGYIFYLIYV